MSCDVGEVTEMLENELSISLSRKMHRKIFKMRASAANTPTATTPEDGSHTREAKRRRGEGILRMEYAGTSEEGDIDSQDSNLPIDHGHLARNCSIKIITPAVKALVISSRYLFPKFVNTL